MNTLLSSPLLPAVLIGCSVLLLALGLSDLLQTRYWLRLAREQLRTFGAVEIGESRRQRLANALNGALARTGLGKWLSRAVDDADLPWQAVTVILLWAALVVVLGLALFLLFRLNFLPTLVLSLMAATGSFAYLFASRKDAYERALQAQTPDIAQLLSNSLNAGQSLLFALKEVELKLPRPANREFHRLQLRLAIGEPMDQALHTFMRRHPSEEMRLLVTSLLVQRRAGGDLITTLANISLAIRAQRRVRNEVDTITAEARQTTLLAIVMPFVVLVILNRVSPGMVADFINWPPGLVFTILVYGVPQVAAFLIIRRLGNVQV